VYALADLPLHVLLVEDDPTDVQLLQEALADVPTLACVVIPVARLAEGLTRLTERPFHVVLLDLNLPDSQGLQTCSTMAGQARGVPIIVLTDIADELLAVSALRAGAQDYLVKGHVDGPLLGRAMRAAIERQRKAADLHASEGRYRRLFETAKDGILLLENASGRITDVNPFLVTLLGRPYDDFLGKELWEIGVFEDKEASKAAFATLQREGYIRYEDLPLVTREGQHIAVEFVSNVYTVDEQRVIQCNIRNITARHQMETALAHERADLRQANLTLTTSHAEIRRFYHTVSHELKTPLTALREFVAIVLDGLAGPLADQQREYLEIAKESCDQMTRGLNDLLDTTRADTGKLHIVLRPMALGAVVARAVTTIAPIAHTNGIRLQQVIAPQLPEVALDAQRIAQVLANLLSNAVKFTPAGGEARVEVRPDPQRPAWVQVLVRDTGCGIAPEHCRHIFDRLYQVPGADPLSTNGLGLGLYISQELVRLHGGELQVQSRLGHGSTFTFSLPAVQGQEAPSSP
jgi:PAS domain S-box-containing protein